MLHTLNYRSDWWNDDSAVPHTLNYGSDWWVIQRFDCTNVNTLWFQYVIQLSFDHWINYKWFIWTNFYCSDLSTHFSRDPFWSKIKLEALRPLGCSRHILFAETAKWWLPPITVQQTVEHSMSRLHAAYLQLVYKFSLLFFLFYKRTSFYKPHFCGIKCL